MPGDDYLDRLRASQETPENAPILEAAAKFFRRWQEAGQRSGVRYGDRERRLMAATVRHFGLDGAGAVDPDRMWSLVLMCQWYARPENRKGKDGRDWYTMDRMFGSTEKTAALLEESAGRAENRGGFVP